MQKDEWLILGAIAIITAAIIVIFISLVFWDRINPEAEVESVREMAKSFRSDTAETVKGHICGGEFYYRRVGEDIKRDWLGFCLPKPIEEWE